MANPEHLAILKEGVEAWNAWRRSRLLTEARGGKTSKPDLSGAGLAYEVLEGVDLHLANLAGANLAGAQVKFCNLVGASMEGADLRHADLTGSDLSAGDLQGANLNRAFLSGLRMSTQGSWHEGGLASSTGTDLSGAILQDAVLWYCQLDGVLLSATDFSGADFGGVSLQNLDLSVAEGLDKVKHSSPSSIDIKTLQFSRGKVPRVFLRGIGLSDALIESTVEIFSGETAFLRAFISYSHTDKPFARRLHDQLQGRGIRCWLDEKKLKPGDRILDVVDGAIRLHEKLLICCSEASLGSWWVKDEIRKAQERERKEERNLIIPLNLDGYLFEWQDGLASDLTSRLAADFTGWEQDNAKFEAEFERVVEALRA